MHVLRDGKLWKAVGLAVGLFLFVVMAGVSVAAHARHTPWDLYLASRVLTLSLAAPTILAGLVTGAFLRPGNPERIAALVGGIGGAVLLAAPQAISYTGAPLSLSTLWYPGLAAALREFVLGPGILALLWFRALPLAVVCWIGANYWRSASSSRFWRGPGGAIIRAGLVAGLAGVPLTFLSSWYSGLRAQELYRFITMKHSLPPYWMANRVVMAVGSVAGAMTIAALLARWRPAPLPGAFAASGIVFLVQALGTALNPALSPQLGPQLVIPVWLTVEAVRVGGVMVTAAIAGSFAGRWEPEPLRDE